VPILWLSQDQFSEDLLLFVRVYNAAGFAEPIPIPSTHQIAAAAAAIVAVNEPVFGRQRFRSLHTKCAAAFYELAKRHFFVNGNKRIATYFLLHLLELNGYMLRVVPERLALFVERVAASRVAERERILTTTAAFVRRHVVELSAWRSGF
jgi:death-on-curing family protein